MQAGENISLTLLISWEAMSEDHTVVITKEGSVVKLVFGGDNDNPVEHGANLRLADQTEQMNVKNS